MDKDYRENLYDLIIIGGGPAGCSAGIYGGRANLRTLILDEGGGGGQIGITNEVVNYPGIPATSGAELMLAMRDQAKGFGTEYIQTGVRGADLSGDIKTVGTDRGEFQALALIIATGAVPRPAGFAGEEDFKGRGVGYCATCDGQFFTGCDIFVIGGGLAACEEAIFLTRYAKQVHLIVRRDQLRCPDTVAEEVLAHEKITVHFRTRMLAVEGDRTLRSARLVNDETGDEWTYTPGEGERFGVFVFAGYQPSSGVFADLVDRDESGYIVTGEDLQTSVKGVYAAGDIRPKALRQLVTAVSDGAVAATSAEKHVQKMRRALNLGDRPEAEPKTGGAEAETPGSAADGAVHSTAFAPELIEQLTPLFGRFENRVGMVALLGGDAGLSGEMEKFVGDFAALSDKLTATVLRSGENPGLEAKIGATRLPVIAILDSGGNPTGIRYHGLPSGHEFTSFVLALYNVAGPGQELDPATAERIGKIDRKVSIQVGVTLTCTMCPDVVQATQKMAALNGNIEAELIDVGQFADFRDQYNILSVPCTVIDGDTVVFGKKTMEELLDQIG